MRTKVLQIIAQHQQLEHELSSPDIANDLGMMEKVGRHYRAIDKNIGMLRSYIKLLDEIQEAREVVETEKDAELIDMAREEIVLLQEQLPAIEEQIKMVLVPKDPDDLKNAIMEIRAGTGGIEAGMFAADLYRMYTRYAETRQWKIEILSSSYGDLNSVKELVFMLVGAGSYGALKFESGVHRVQRVPQTESQGRIHTSAATVVVLPEADEFEIAIDPNDLRIDVFRSSGPGGQSVNTTDSAVRIVHVPTGLMVSCQDEKSQHKNKAKAMKVLQSRLYDLKLSEVEASESAARRSMVGSGDRSAKIRTYNFPQSRVTDHRINLTLYRLEEILNGDMDELLETLALADLNERLKRSN